LDRTNDIFSDLAPLVKYDFLKALYSDLILENIFFTHFDKEFAVRIVPLLKPIRFVTGEYIWDEGDFSSNIILLVKGQVKFFISNLIEDSEEEALTTFQKTVFKLKRQQEEKNKTKKIYDPTSDKKIVIFKVMESGSYFGDVDIYFKRRRTCGAIASSECEGFTLTRKEFENVISQEFSHIYKILADLAIERAVRDIDMKNQCLETVSKVDNKHNLKIKSGLDEKVILDSAYLISLAEILSSTSELLPIQDAVINSDVNIKKGISQLYKELVNDLNSEELASVKELYLQYKSSHLSNIRGL